MRRVRHLLFPDPNPEGSETACDILLSTHTGLAPGADGRFITSAGDLGGSPRHRLNPRLCRSCASATSLPAASLEAPVLCGGRTFLS